MPIKLKNNATGFLASAISASDTGLVLQAGNGAAFSALGAGEYFYATLVSAGGTLEVVKVTARVGDTMTVVRAQEGSAAAGFAAGSRLEQRVTAQSVLDAVGDVVASQVGFTPTGGIAATDVQAALAEVDSEKVAFTRLDDSDGASLVGFLQAGTNAVTRTAQSKLRETVSVKDFGAVGDGVTDDTAAIQAAVNAADTVCFPAGTYRVTSAVTCNSVLLLGQEGASILPALGTAGGNVLQATTGYLEIDGLTFDGGASQPTAAVANTYIINAGNPAAHMDRVRVENCKFISCNAVGGAVVTTNLLVTHCVYLQGVTTAIITKNSFDTISGAACFYKEIANLRQSKNVMLDVQWYNTNLDYNVSGSISDDYYNCTLANGMYWGGAINTANNQGEVQNHDLVIERCKFAGKYSYGAVVRLQSDKGVTVQDCDFLQCTLGSLASGGTLTAIGVTTRNPDGVTPSNPPSDIKIIGNRALYGFGSITPPSFLAFVYINNDHGTGGRAPIYGITIENNTALSPSASSYFTQLALINGRNAGCEEVSVMNNYGQVYLKTAQPVGGGIGLVGVDANGTINYVKLGKNYIENLETPVSSTQAGIQIGGYVNLVRSVAPNTVKGCFYGVRTLANAGPTLELLDDQYFSSNITDTLFTVALSRYGKLLYGSAAGSSSIATGTTTTQNITITGAAFGDIPLISLSGEIAGLHVSAAKVRVANSVQILYTNTTGGVIDASSLTVYVTVTKRSTT